MVCRTDRSAWMAVAFVVASSVYAQSTGDPLAAAAGGDSAAPKACKWVSRTELSCEAGAVPDAETVGIGIGEAKTSVRQGDYAAAATILGQIVSDTTEDASLLALYGEVLVASGDARAAVPILERAIAAAPGAPRLHFQLATAHTTLGNVDRALEAYAAEIEANEETEVRFLAYFNRSILLNTTGRSPEAAAALELALALAPDKHPEAYGDLATAYLGAGDPAKALDALDRGMKVGFRSARLYFNVGARLFNDKDYVQAESAFTHALEIDPGMADAERSLASVLNHLGRPDDARKHLARYLELRPEAPDADQVRQLLAAAAE
jgi:tetratricopeptide (TPR) repeat protein